MVPLAVTENVTLVPIAMVAPGVAMIWTLLGGPTLTVRVAGMLVAVPYALVTTTV